MPGLPPCVSLIVCSKKDKLYSHFIGLLKEENVSFSASEVNSSGRNFTKTAVDCLWYVDGHHDTLQKQHVRNVDTMLQCDECGMWRLLYC